jgi:hypothetical protein
MQRTGRAHQPNGKYAFPTCQPNGNYASPTLQSIDNSFPPK